LSGLITYNSKLLYKWTQTINQGTRTIFYVDITLHACYNVRAILVLDSLTSGLILTKLLKGHSLREVIDDKTQFFPNVNDMALCRKFRFTIKF